jgi:hypothetical protein
MRYSIFKKSNWMVLLTAGIVFAVLAATPVFADYTGHVASFKSEENAAKFVDSLKAKGLAAYYLKEDVPGKGEFYRTYIGGYKTLPLAQKALAKLKKAGEIDFFKIQKTTGNSAGIAAKKTETAAQKTEPTQKPESKLQIAEQKNKPVQKPDNKTGIAVQNNEPEKKIEVATQKADPAQKPEKKIAPPIDTRHYYSGIKGIVLKNGKIIRGQIISIDDNDMLKIRTKRGKILSYSFTREVKEYITEYEP